MKGLIEWLDRRTGVGTAWRWFFYQSIPGGARWRYAWSTVLLFTFLVQAVTGFFLLGHYSASSQTAWESVFFLQYQVPGGWLLRGLHVITAQVFTVLLALHLMQQVIGRAYLAPREVNFWLLLALLPLVIGLSVTGWLLPHDQKGFWAARVPLNLLGILPLVGPDIQRLLIGGSDLGHYTLTRFVALHTVLLPALTGSLLGLYIYLTRRHGLSSLVQPAGQVNPARLATPESGSSAAYWPDQALRDAIACLAVVVTVLFVVLRPRLLGHGQPVPELLGPANPAEPYSAARPEWFMLWLFQFLKLFPGGTELWGAVILPLLVVLVIALMPWIGRWRLGPGFNTGFMLALVAGVIVLTALAVSQDRTDPEYQAARRAARIEAARANVLAQAPTGIPPSGALSLLQGDPLTQGPRLFARNCASCHRYDGNDGAGRIPKEPPAASDLKGYGGREWLTGLLDPQRIASLHYFGGTKLRDGKMVRFVTKDVAGFSPAERAQLEQVIVALSAEAQLKSQREADRRDARMILEGKELIENQTVRCTECHLFHRKGDEPIGPDLTGYASREWLMAFVADPAHERFYGKKNDRMPLFGKDEVLDARSIGLVVDWLRGEWYQESHK